MLSIISWNNFVYVSIQTVFTLFKYGFKAYNYVSKKIKKRLINHIDFKSVKSYNSFEIQTYEFIKDEKTYLFNFLIKNSDKNNTQLITTLIDDTYENIVEKDFNKNKILHASFMTDNENILCEISEELRRLRYYFDCYKEYEYLDGKIVKTDSVHQLYWKDIIEIISVKYNREINPNNVYLYTIINDDLLSEKTELLSSMLNKKVRF